MKKNLRKRLKRRKRFVALSAFEKCIGDLFVKDDVQQMKDIKHHLNLSCLDHSLFVSYVSYRICRFLNLDYRSAARGGLLHDLFLYDWREKESHEGWHGTSHPEVALKNAEQLCSDADLEDLNNVEKDMISKHMWPLTKKMPSYKESMIICIVDKICAMAEMTLIFRIINFKCKHFEVAAKAA